MALNLKRYFVYNLQVIWDATAESYNTRCTKGWLSSFALYSTCSCIVEERDLKSIQSLAVQVETVRSNIYM